MSKVRTKKHHFSVLRIREAWNGMMYGLIESPPNLTKIFLKKKEEEKVGSVEKPFVRENGFLRYRGTDGDDWWRVASSQSVREEWKASVWPPYHRIIMIVIWDWETCKRKRGSQGLGCASFPFPLHVKSTTTSPTAWSWIETLPVLFFKDLLSYLFLTGCCCYRLWFLSHCYITFIFSCFYFHVIPSIHILYCLSTLIEQKKKGYLALSPLTFVWPLPQIWPYYNCSHRIRF